MSKYEPAPEGKDPVLWELAQKRASFKKHFISYVLVNGFLWALWFITEGRHDVFAGKDLFWGYNIPWPVWPTFGWGIGIVSHFASAYIFPEANSVEREYEKLKNKK
ncbi:MAG: 2TM domain-containing protein [Ferruginibacter sp.]